MEELINQLRYLIGGYYGVMLIDEYPLKEFALADIKKYIDDFCSSNSLNLDLWDEVFLVSDRVKLQDALILLNKMNYSMDLVFLVKKYLKKLGRKEYL